MIARALRVFPSAFGKSNCTVSPSTLVAVRRGPATALLIAR
jgi:hypothetical protein